MSTYKCQLIRKIVYMQCIGTQFGTSVNCVSIDVKACYYKKNKKSVIQVKINVKIPLLLFLTGLFP